MKAGWTLGFEPDGRELLVVAIKGTFCMPVANNDPTLAPDQLPLTMADEFSGEPGVSAPLRETDFAHRKPMCDFVLNGSAYAPGGRPTTRVTVGMRVGSVVKTFGVVGDRVWQQSAFGITHSSPRPFVTMPVSYDNAFGGIQPDHSDPTQVLTFQRNPAGRGFRPNRQNLIGSLLPNTEDLLHPVTAPDVAYAPQAFGSVGRNWWPRRRHAGTYDATWLQTRAPFWPSDFNYLYFQSAPEEQQIPYLAGGEQVVLQNLTPDGLRNFAIPRLVMPVLFLPHRGPDRGVDATIDTLFLEPDFERFSMTWRANLPLRRNCFELKETIVGEMPTAWHRARRTAHKRFFAGLGELAAAKQRAGSE